METPSEVAKQLRHNFAESTVWEFERVLGSGMYGVAVLVRLRKPWEHGMPSQAVLKRAIGQFESESLSQEIMFTEVRRMFSLLLALGRCQSYEGNLYQQLTKCIS
jgi:hypothetical protein